MHTAQDKTIDCPEPEPGEIIMSGSYKREKIRDALVNNKGNANLAKAVLIRQLASDDKLLRELVAPFIDGIVAHAIEHYARAHGVPLVRQSPGAKPKPVPQMLAPEQLDAVVAAMHKNAGPQDSAGLEGLLSKPDRARHADVMRSIAKPLKTLGSDYFDRS